MFGLIITFSTFDDVQHQKTISINQIWKGIDYDYYDEIDNETIWVYHYSKLDFDEIYFTDNTFWSNPKAKTGCYALELIIQLDYYTNKYFLNCEKEIYI